MPEAPQPRADSDDDVNDADDKNDADTDNPLDPDAPTVINPVAAAAAMPELPPAFSTARLFGSPAFFRLWLAQVVSSLGDWVGIVAITALAAHIGKKSPETAISLVLSARLVPGFFLAPVAGVLVDRWNRKRLMVFCDIGRGAVLATLPFIKTIPGLVIASLFLEMFTLLWGPAKDASVPKLVKREYLATANSLSLVASYGTFPIGSLVFAALAGVAKFLGRYNALRALKVDQEFVAMYFDVVTFFVSASLISTLNLSRQDRATPGEEKAGIDFASALRDIREGLSFITHSPLIRSVILAIATGLIGGGMLVPLGPPFASRVLGGGSAAFGLLLTALGFGVAAGVVTLSIIQKRLPHERVFILAVMGAGASILAGASMSTLTPALGFVFLLGVCAGAVYILGYTILQSNVEDELRGRIFATLNALVRFCLLLAFAAAPALSGLLDNISHRVFNRSVQVLGLHVGIPGVRLTLWLGGLIILGAGALTVVGLRGASGRQRAE